MEARKQGRAKPAARRDSGRELVSLLRRMWVIRAFEEKVSALYAAREIVGLLHLRHRAGSRGGRGLQRARHR